MGTHEAPWSLANQRRRVERVLALVRPAMRGYFAADGTPLPGHESHFALRECMHASLALLTGDAADVALANAILDRAHFSSCDFSTLTIIEIAQRHAERLTAANRAKLRAHAAHEAHAVQRPHNAYIGYNDNFPSMACAIMVLGGELAGDADAVQAGVDTLYSLRDLLTRRGHFSEYNSPTYAAVTLRALHGIATTARHAEARELARDGALRMWLDVCAHWHPGTSWQAGPQSRAYHVDSTLSSSHLHTLAWMIFGDDVWPSPPELYFGEGAEERFEHVIHRLAYMQAALPGYSSNPMELPDWLAHLAFAKTFPYRAAGTAEMGTFHSGDYRVLPGGGVAHVPGQSVDFRADGVQLTTYMEAPFALGSATRGFLNGAQTEVCYALWRRLPEGRGRDAVRAAFARYLVGPCDLGAEMRGGLIANHGLAWAVQDDRRVLALYHPNGYRHEGVDSLRLGVFLPETACPVDDIWIGDRRLEGGIGTAAAADWVIVRDGGVLLALYPLAPDNLGRPCLVQVERVGELRLISFRNYDGAPRDFEAARMGTIGNGFVCEMATTAEYAGPAAFLAELRRSEVSDSTVMETRRVRYRRAGRELMLWVDPCHQGLKAAVVNGQAVNHPPLAVDGLDPAVVPWLGKPLAHDDLGWWCRIAARPPVAGLEGVSGRRVD